MSRISCSFHQPMGTMSVLFTGRPKLPGYQPKTTGRNLLVYELGAVWKRELDRGLIAVSGLGVEWGRRMREISTAATGK